MSTDTPGHGGGPRPTETDRPGGLPDRVADDVLAGERRRTMLAELATASDPVPVSRLAAAVAAAETGGDTADVPAERRERVKEELYEHEVPMLTALQVATFDSRVACLALAEHAGDVLDRWEQRSAEGDLPASP